MNLFGAGAWKLVAFRGCPAFYTSTPPNWFHRTMQRLFFGFRWERE